MLFQRAFIARHWILDIITLVWSNKQITLKMHRSVLATYWNTMLQVYLKPSCNIFSSNRLLDTISLSQPNPTFVKMNWTTVHFGLKNFYRKCKKYVGQNLIWNGIWLYGVFSNTYIPSKPKFSILFITRHSYWRNNHQKSDQMSLNFF